MATRLKFSYMRRVTLTCILITAVLGCSQAGGVKQVMGEKIKLPEPKKQSDVSVEEAIAARRSRRQYAKGALTLTEISQLLWAAQGITNSRGFRAAPSAGATYPLETYLVAGKVEGLDAGLYHYELKEHRLTKVQDGDRRRALCQAAWGQDMITEAPISLVFAAIYERTTGRYGERGIRYIHMEVGHVGENVHLQCETMGLGTVVIGAFSDGAVKKALGIEEEPLYIMPVGRKLSKGQK